MAGNVDISGNNSLISDAPFAPLELLEPASWSAPFIFASPHSGRRYPADLFDKTNLSLAQMRASEDAYVDLLVDDLPTIGVPVLKALFPRLMLDVNRAANELDPQLFDSALPHDANSRSTRVMAGFGVIPRLGAAARPIYKKKLHLSEAQERLKCFYFPYHQAVRQLIEQAKNRFGCAILIDCHSMPSQGMSVRGPNGAPVDIVLGDRFGHSCDSGLTSLAERLFADVGFVVTRNAPYAGGYVAHHYGKPAQGVHVLQVEIARRLYMDENRIIRHGGFERLKSQLASIFDTLIEVAPDALQPKLAAE